MYGSSRDDIANSPRSTEVPPEKNHEIFDRSRVQGFSTIPILAASVEATPLTDFQAIASFFQHTTIAVFSQVLMWLGFAIGGSYSQINFNQFTWECLSSHLSKSSLNSSDFSN